MEMRDHTPTATGATPRPRRPAARTPHTRPRTGKASSKIVHRSVSGSISWSSALRHVETIVSAALACFVSPRFFSTSAGHCASDSS